MDVEAAKRILTQQRRKRDGDDEEYEQRRREIVRLFMRFDDRVSEGRAAVLEGLQLVGEATAKMAKLSVTTHDSSESSVVDYPESPWKLVTLFCRTHGLPRSMALLQELARTNDWVIFLHEAQREKCDPSTVLRIVDAAFTDPRLKDHLHIAMRNMAAEFSSSNRRGDEVMAVTTAVSSEGKCSDNVVVDGASSTTRTDVSRSGVRRRDDIFELLFAASKSRDCSETLLRWALVGHERRRRVDAEGEGSSTLRRPVLAVLAKCVGTCATLDCWIVWLIASCGLALPLDRSTGQSRDNDVDGIPTHGWDIYHLNLIVSSLCRKRRFVELIRSFQIFSPTNPLLEFVLFYQAFALGRPSHVLDGHLQTFVRDTRRADATPASGESTIVADEVSGKMWTDWALSVAQAEIAYLVDEVERSQDTLVECGVLLRALAVSRFADSYRRLYRSFDLLRRTEQLQNRPRSLFRQPQRILDLLLRETSHFEEARMYTVDMLSLGEPNLSTQDLHRVTLSKVTSVLQRFRSSAVWRFASEGSSERGGIWNRCWKLFTLHDYPAIDTASFFLSISQPHHASRDSDLKTDLLPGDHVQLLEMVRTLLGSGNEPLVPGDFLRSLDDYILLYSLDCGSCLPSLPLLSTVRRTSSDEKTQLATNDTRRYVMSSLSRSAKRDVARAIDKLLRQYNIERAMQLSASFDERPIVLAAIHAAQQLAESSKSSSMQFERDLVKLLPLQVKRLIQSHSHRRSVPLVEMSQRKLALFDALVQTAPESSVGCIQRIAVTWRASQLLRRSYDDVRDADATAVLRTLLLLAMRHRSGMEGSRVDGEDTKNASVVLRILDVASTFVRSRQIDPRRVATALARFFYDASMVARSLVQVTRSSWQGWATNELDQYVRLSSDPRLIGSHILKLVRESIDLSGGGGDDDDDDDESVRKRVSPALDDVGGETASSSRLPVECEVQLMIVAHFCHVRGGSVTGLTATLGHIYGRISLYERENPALLLRLLVGTGEYHALEFVIGRLIVARSDSSSSTQSDRDVDGARTTLERLLHMSAEPNVAKSIRDLPNYFKAAILRFIRRHRRDDLALFTRFCIDMHMHRDLADELRARADARVAYASRRLNEGSTATDAVRRVVSSALFEALQLYVEAARCYRREDSHQLASLCQAKASLTLLQEDVMDKGTVLIGLSPSEAISAMIKMSRTCLQDANVIATAYGQQRWQCWVPSAYDRCVASGDPDFMYVHAASLSLSLSPSPTTTEVIFCLISFSRQGFSFFAFSSQRNSTRHANKHTQGY